MAKQPTLEQLTQDIDTIIDTLESKDISIENAVKKYNTALKTAQKIHTKLKKIDTQITVLKQQSDMLQEKSNNGRTL
jgi:exodeoxyribonuclease VII small subunit